MTRHTSSNGATMSGCHHKRMGLGRQAQVDREFIELSLESAIELGTEAQRQEAEEAQRWLKAHRGVYARPKGGRR